jgi:hypothetical protein
MERDYCPCGNREKMIDLQEYQLNKCKTCINSEFIEFTDDTNSYYLCHEVMIK